METMYWYFTFLLDKHKVTEVYSKYPKHWTLHIMKQKKQLAKLFVCATMTTRQKKMFGNLLQKMNFRLWVLGRNFSFLPVFHWSQKGLETSEVLKIHDGSNRPKWIEETKYKLEAIINNFGIFIPFSQNKIHAYERITAEERLGTFRGHFLL